MQNHLRQILKFRDARDWKQFHSPKNLSISLALEAAEILETFQWTADNELPKAKKKEFELEIADVYYYLLLLAHEAEIDIDKAFAEKMIVNKKRYPVSKARGNSRKYNEL
ncbi:MAG: nucleotide pyrophosphohydrolase [Bacteroidota bacterium]|jgi:NTP pyrophosphatase (non-canonical NTP hydrolase)